MSRRDPVLPRRRGCVSFRGSVADPCVRHWLVQSCCLTYTSKITVRCSSGKANSKLLLSKSGQEPISISGLWPTKSSPVHNISLMPSSRGTLLGTSQTNARSRGHVYEVFLCLDASPPPPQRPLQLIYIKSLAAVCITLGGNIFPVHDRGERYYLRLLLTHIAGDNSFQHLRTVDG